VNSLRNLQRSYSIARQAGDVVEGKLLPETFQHDHDQAVETLYRNRVERKLIGDFNEHVHEVEDELGSAAVLSFEIAFWKSQYF